MPERPTTFNDFTYFPIKIIIIITITQHTTSTILTDACQRTPLMFRNVDEAKINEM